MKNITKLIFAVLICVLNLAVTDAACPLGPLGKNCSSKGTCINNNNCRCVTGYISANCAIQGYNGGIVAIVLTIIGLISGLLSPCGAFIMWLVQKKKSSWDANKGDAFGHYTDDDSDAEFVPSVGLFCGGMIFINALKLTFFMVILYLVNGKNTFLFGACAMIYLLGAYTTFSFFKGIPFAGPGAITMLMCGAVSIVVEIPVAIVFIVVLIA